MENKISTGSYDLNSWLYGGYEKEVITMVAGPPGSGKTNMAMLAACSQAKLEKKVIFIDTEGGFSVERVKQIAGENYEMVLKNMFLLNPTNFEEQKKCFLKLFNKIKKEDVSLIVIDGVAMLYRLEVGNASLSKDEAKIKNINKEVSNQMKFLSEIVRKQKIPVIITNQVYSEFLSEENFRKGVKPAVNLVGGDIFKYWCKCIIELKNESGKRKAVLLKHRNLKNKEMLFEIKDKGIFKKGWI